MSKRYSKFALLFPLAFCCLRATEPNPRAVVESFFAPEGVHNKGDIYTGEMLQYAAERTMGQHYGSGATKDYRLLSSSDAYAVYAVTVKANGTAQDWYAFVRKSNGVWRLEAVRTLAQTGLISIVAAGLRKKEKRSADEDWKLRNADLTLQSDAALKAYLQDNLSKFEALVQLIKTREGDSDAAAKQIYLRSAKAAESGAIEFIIGGILDNTVGYMYLPDGVSPPRLQPDDVIYIERIVDHWYIFKTT